jgi:hypothetical protein
MIFSTSVIALWEVNRSMDVRRSLTRLGSNAVVRKLAPVEERAVAISVENDVQARRGMSHDPQIAIRRIPALFAENKSKDREAAKPRYLQVASRRRKTRARRTIFQAALAPVSIRLLAGDVWSIPSQIDQYVNYTLDDFDVTVFS